MKVGLRPAMKRLGLVLLGLAVGLLAAEGVLRLLVVTGALTREHAFVVFLDRLHAEPAEQSLYRISDDPELAIELVPGARRRHLRINSHGFRGPEVQGSPSPGVTRVAVLGDSETFGALLAEADTLPAQLQHQLNRSGASRFEVLNLGVPGYNTRQELALLTRRVLGLEPDIVVLVYTLNDAFLGVQAVLVPRSVLSRSYLWAFASFTASRQRPSYYQLVHHQGRLVDTYRDLYASIEFADCALLLRQMAAEVTGRGLPFMVVIAPEIIGFDDLSHYPYHEIHQRVRDVLPSSVEVVDTLDDLAALGVPPHDLWVAPADCHKNAVANSVMARAVAARLLQAAPTGSTATTHPLEPDPGP